MCVTHKGNPSDTRHTQRAIAEDVNELTRHVMLNKSCLIDAYLICVTHTGNPYAPYIHISYV